MLSRIIFAILPVVFKFLFEELKNYLATRDKSEIKIKDMQKAIKANDLDRINELFNATKLRNKERKAGISPDKLQ